MDIVERLSNFDINVSLRFDNWSAFRELKQEVAAEIERLRQFEKDWQAMRDERDAARTGYDCLLGENRELVKLEVENERLRIENIQMRFALGYPMPSDLERHIIPANPFKCGICDARAALPPQPERIETKS